MSFVVCKQDKFSPCFLFRNSFISARQRLSWSESWRSVLQLWFRLQARWGEAVVRSNSFIVNQTQLYSYCRKRKSDSGRTTAGKEKVIATRVRPVMPQLEVILSEFLICYRGRKCQRQSCLQDSGSLETKLGSISIPVVSRGYCSYQEYLWRKIFTFVYAGSFDCPSVILGCTAKKK
jgi:hypothetical protein